MTRGIEGVVSGDGIGPEVVAEGVRCLKAIAQRVSHQFTLHEEPFGGAAKLHGDEADAPAPKDR
jgi:3-isopropylmalate dehydrogenase